jgi:hypothetical protein
LLNNFVNGRAVSRELFLSSYDVAGLSVLVGLTTAQMRHKLRDVFDAFFEIAKGADKERLEDL